MSFVMDEVRGDVEKAPDKCPITGLRKCTSYTIDENVVYLSEPAYNAYTLPCYDEEEKAFYRTKYDMDDDCRADDEYLCDLEDLKDRNDFDEIKRFYEIVD